MNYYRKPINKIVDDVKLKMQLGALTLKISENNNKIDDLLKVDENIKKDIVDNTSKIGANENDISSNLIELNNIKNNMNVKLRKNIFDKTYIIPNKTIDFINNKHLKFFQHQYILIIEMKVF